MTGTPRSAASQNGTGGAVPFAAVVVIVLSIVLVKALPSPGSLDRMPDPPSGPDRVPAGPVVEAYPEHCGISAATLARLVPDARTTRGGGQGTCTWSSQKDDRRSERHLSVGFTLFHGSALRPGMPQPGRAPAAAAMRSLGPRWSNVPGTAVTGLGDEAFMQFSPSTGSTVVMRVGNANVTVQYRSIFWPIPKKTAQDGAFAAASEVVAALGARTPARPAIAAAPQPTPARAVPDLCAAVSERTVHRLVEGDSVTGEPTSRGGALAIKDAKVSNCSWTSMDRELSVSAAVVPGSDLFDGARLATREYAMRHDDARTEETLSVHDKRYFRAVPGLGDQAFAVQIPEVIPGEVVFRDGNVLVRVTYEAADERKPLSRKHAIRGAYAAAQEVAQALAAH
ncbi:hypothetical protein HUT06_24095 [Actinomadura sp. NAK00032]|uniref:hypothetical protein n=1 Tax=Actinomadura sp. NAK00032 TaxID=2742128 RepID=UPI0015925E5F|nr:hypothetical protein [Actinomadura sp. NAK00032]QKW36726.1 hypothetical protein HUT06_24095 [Actinomadura sp. NAK00032]